MKFCQLSAHTLVAVCIYMQGENLDIRWSKTMTWEEWTGEGGPFNGIPDLEKWGSEPRRSGEAPNVKKITLCEGVEVELYVSKSHPIGSWIRFRLNATSASRIQDKSDALEKGGWTKKDNEAARRAHLARTEAKLVA